MASYGAGDGEPGASDESGESDVLVAEPAGQAVSAWRRWRYTRPFWGGLLIIFAGAEMLLSEQAPLPVIVHIGVQGLAGYLVPIVLVLCGLLIWLNPLQQTFYSVLAVLLALGSWITSNLGGFFVGLIAGVIGGALAFAWSRGGDPPVRPAHIRWRRPWNTPSEGLSLILGDEAPDAPYEDADDEDEDEDTDEDEDAKRPQPESPRGDDEPSGGGRTGSVLLAFSAVPVVLMATVVTASPTPSLTPGPGVTARQAHQAPVQDHDQGLRAHPVACPGSAPRSASAICVVGPFRLKAPRALAHRANCPTISPPIPAAFPLTGISVTVYLAAGRRRAAAYDVARGRRGAGDSCGSGIRVDRVGRATGATARDRASPPGVGRGPRAADAAS